ncbi:MAG: fibronectin type III domain-containing protein [Proteobacteria bacterium]|nr:fibronectin type III domain-containing protein [Pseudomonadota bacterium]
MSVRIVKTLLITFSVMFPIAALSAPNPPTSVTAEDRPNDGGGAILVRWVEAGGDVLQYQVLRIDNDGDRHEAGDAPPGDHKLVDTGSKKAPLYDGVPYQYVVRAVYADGDSVESVPSTPATAEPSWFNWGRLPNLLAVLFFAAMFFILVRRGSKGAASYIRPIAGLSALNDAVGRAAEMARPVLYAPGLQAASQPATVASMSILSEVTRRAARLRTRVKVPNYSPLTWPVAQNVMKEAYLKEGRAEDFNPDDVTYLTSRSFTYAAAVVGMMVREKPASNFLIGHFFSESLILAETGAATGAVQIGGTDSVTQLPFFITTCDYTMIGEELFAAAAQVSDDPVSRSTIAAHDWFKAVAMALMIAGLMLGLLDALGLDGASEVAQKLAALLRENK